MNTLKLLLIALLCLHFQAYSQPKGYGLKSKSNSKGTEKQEPGKFGLIPGLGYMWQGHNNIELQLIALIMTGREFDNFSLYGGYDLFKHNVTYGSKFLGLSYRRAFTTERMFSQRLACYYSTTKVMGVSDQRVTTEYGIGSILYSLSVGYSIPVGNTQLPWMRDFRIALRIPGF